MNKCNYCGKTPKTGNNKPNSQHRTKRKFKPNLQKRNGEFICVKCSRTLDKD